MLLLDEHGLEAYTKCSTQTTAQDSKKGITSDIRLFSPALAGVLINKNDTEIVTIHIPVYYLTQDGTKARLRQDRIDQLLSDVYGGMASAGITKASFVEAKSGSSSRPIDDYVAGKVVDHYSRFNLKSITKPLETLPKTSFPDLPEEVIMKTDTSSSGPQYLPLHHPRYRSEDHARRWGPILDRKHTCNVTVSHDLLSRENVPKQDVKGPITERDTLIIQPRLRTACGLTCPVPQNLRDQLDSATSRLLQSDRSEVRFALEDLKQDPSGDVQFTVNAALRGVYQEIWKDHQRSIQGPICDSVSCNTEPQWSMSFPLDKLIEEHQHGSSPTENRDTSEPADAGHESNTIATEQTSSSSKGWHKSGGGLLSRILGDKYTGR